MKSSNPRWALVALRHTFDWKGRARRAEAWWSLGVFVALVLLVLAALWVLHERAGFDASTDSWPLSPYWLIALGLVSCISCAIRRLHDLDRSGKWFLIIITSMVLAIPFFLTTMAFLSIGAWLLLTIFAAFSGIFILFYWFLQRGTIGENRYGPDPLMVD